MGIHERRDAWIMACTLALTACGSEIAPAPPTCAFPNRLLDDGSCAPTGIPPEMCGAGFAPSGDGCEPILPADPCPRGLVAVPGDSECHEVMPCGAGKWGDIPIEPGAQYVDGSYAGGNSDGSSEKPWTSIAPAIAAATPGAIVAIAAGSYAEDLVVEGKSVRIWGACPANVEIVGSAAALAALFIRAGASGTEVHGLAIRGSSQCVIVSAATGVVLDRLWLHDAGGRGIHVENVVGSTSVAVHRSLVEQNHEFGIVLLAGSEALIEGTVVRGTLPSDQHHGRGLSIEGDRVTGASAKATVTGSLVEQNQDIGLFVIGSEALIDGTVVRGTLPRASDQAFGRGIAVEKLEQGGAASKATVRASLIENNHDIGIFVAGSEALIEATVVRGTLSRASDLNYGRGIGVRPDPTSGTPASTTIRASIVEHSQDVGIFVAGSEATLDEVTVRHTAMRQADGLFGDGVLVVSELGPATVSLTRCTVSDNVRAGLSSFGASATVVDSTFACSGFDLEGEVYQNLPFVFDDRGGNACGCPAGSEPCGVESTGIEPPEPLQPNE